MGKSILVVLLCLSVGVFGFTVGRFTDVGNFGGKTFHRGQMVTEGLSKLNDQEKEIATRMVRGTDVVAKKVVEALGPAAKDEQKFKSMLEQLDKDPMRVLQMAAMRGQKPPAQEEDPNKVWKVEPGNVPTKGPENAPITLVEFSEFQCPFCARGYAVTKQLEEKYPGKIRFQFVSKILPMHKKAPGAHAAAYAAWAQNKFWEFHDLAFQNQKDLSDEKYLEWAKQIGLDMNQFKADLAVEKHQAEFDRLEKVSNDLEVRGTPTFFINGRKIRGARPLETFTEVIDKLLAEGSGAPAAPAAPAAPQG
ncbi:MAG: thioredoxin domain-containing protein [Deltaproteobacteria bacterium]|nr:thioredoxin domain-containing protein [Deltaproteobacteria bacterium]